MNHKFTLYCRPGRLFRPGLHYLVLDEWLLDPSYLVLCNGIMSEQEYQHIMQKKSVSIFQSVSFSWVGLYSSHESRKYADTQYCGRLYRKSNKEWRGYINVY